MGVKRKAENAEIIIFQLLKVCSVKHLNNILLKYLKYQSFNMFSLDKTLKATNLSM